MTLIEARVEIRPEHAERCNDALLENEATGWSVFEEVVLRRAWLIGIFPTRVAAAGGVKELKAILPADWLEEPEYREMAEAEWRDSYKAHFHAWQFGRLHWVPVWQRDSYRVPEGGVALWLDPGLAFGTGNHETTRLCVERLVAIADRRGANGRVVDAGCGSGILALSAAKLGFTHVLGFDNDAEAVRVSRENAVLNGLESQVHFAVGDLTMLADTPADVLMANILADVLIRFAPELAAAVQPGGVLVLSGILASECAQVARRFEEIAPGWSQQSRTLGEWSDLMLLRPDR